MGKVATLVSEFDVGDMVRTDDPLEPRDYSQEAQAVRRADAIGRVVAREDSYITVRHLDGVVAYYDPDELIIERKTRLKLVN